MNEKIRDILILVQEVCDTLDEPEYPLDMLVEKLENIKAKLKDIKY